MWHLVEKRFLLHNSHYVVAASASSPGAAAPGIALDTDGKRRAD
jgi:hypothetical protein